MRESVYFLSDVHLGAAYIDDHRAHEDRIVTFLKSIEQDAAELYLLGDILDYWYEYRNVVPRGFVRFFGQLARMSDAGVHITWMTGNHDIWLFDYLRDEIGIEIIDAPYIKRRVGDHTAILAHGDRIGRQKPAFRFICSLFRNKICQKLYAGIHPRLTVPFAHGWSKSSRMNATECTDQARVDEIRAMGSDLLSMQADADALVMGHYHIPAEIPLPDGKEIIVLGDWIQHFTYAKYTPGGNIELKKYVISHK